MRLFRALHPARLRAEGQSRYIRFPFPIESAEISHVVIAPDLSQFVWTDFHRSDDILKVGQAAAEEAAPKIKSLLPFFADYCRVPLGISLTAY